MTNPIYPIAVIGGGSAGTMAVLRSVLNNDETLFFPGTNLDKKRSRALWVSKVENMPAHFGYKKGIEQPNRETFDWLKKSEFADKFLWQKNRGITEIAQNHEGIFQLTDNKGESYRARFVILCTGIMDVQPHISGSIEPVFPYANMQSLDYCLRCDGHHVLGKKTGVIGHTSGAAWVASMLHERYAPPEMHLFLHGQKDEFSDEVKKLIKLYQFQIHEEEIVEIRGDQKKGLLASFLLASGKEVEVGMSFISLGSIVYNQLAKSLHAKLDERGYVVTNEKGESSVSGLYVAGDLRANAKKQIYTAWDQAVDSADDINARLRKARRQELLKEAKI